MAVYDDLINGHNPISWWKLDETTGTTLVDQTSFKDLTIAGTYTLDVSSGAHAGVGAGIDFSDGHATTTVTTGDYTPTAMTVIAWVNLDATNIDFASIISRTNTSGSTSAMGWGIAFDDVGGVFFKVKDTTSTSGTAAFLATWATPPTGTLTMIIGEWAANGPTRIYSNGDNLEDTSSDTNITEVIDNESNILLGGAPNDGARRLDGKIYDVVVLGKTLTGAEKDALYAAGRSSVNLGVASETDTAPSVAVMQGIDSLRAELLSFFDDGQIGAFFNVSDLSTLFQDDAGTTPVTTDGDPVGRVEDQSGNALHWTNTGADRPTYRTDGYHHWIEVDGTGTNNQNLQTPDFIVSSQAMLFAGFQTSVAETAFRTYLRWEASGADDRRMSLNSNNANQGRVRVDTPSDVNVTAGNVGPLDVPAVYGWGVESDAPTFQRRGQIQDGEDSDVTGSALTGTVADTGFIRYGFSTTGLIRCFGFLMRDGTFTSQQEADIKRFLAWYAGTPVVVETEPENHPFTGVFDFAADTGDLAAENTAPFPAPTVSEGYSDWLSSVSAYRTFGDDKTTIRPASEAPFDTDFFRCTIPEGTSSPSDLGSDNSGSQWLADFFSADRAWLRYRVRFGAGFDWVKGGKLPGLQGGDAPTGGGVSDAGFTTRMMWRENGQGELYAYFYNKSGSSGESIGRGEFTFADDTWYTIEQEVKMNTVDGATVYDDGYVRIWIDGSPVFQVSRMIFRDTTAVTIQGIISSIFFGGTGAEWRSTKEETVDTGDFQVWVSDSTARTLSAGLATETDTALAITGQKTVALGLATETDTALAVSRVIAVSLGLATETDTALAVTGAKLAALGLATETDTALAVTFDRVVALGLATETDTALGLAVARFVDIGLATETDTAPGMTIDRALALGLATETDTAPGVAVLIARTLMLGVAQEVSTAFRLDFGIEPFRFLLYKQTTPGNRRAPIRLRPLVFVDRTDGKKYIIMHNGAGLAELQEFTPKFTDEIFKAFHEPTLRAGAVLVRVYVESGELKAERYGFEVRKRPILFGQVARPWPDQPVYQLILDEQDVDWEN